MLYKPGQTEPKWQKLWQKTGLYQTDLISAKKPYYNLMMYPYPSAEGLHVGNMYAFTGSDVWGRFMRMSGYDVFEPIGVDSGGIHSENFAIKMGVHPNKMVARNVKSFTRQLKKIGNMFDWDHFIDVMQPSYYQWTQWIFTELFLAGLAEKKESMVTWCPLCKTTVSDEQTEQKNTKTVCERCKTEVEKKPMKQWFFKITKYADRLLNDLDQLDWSAKVKTAQANWIGRSNGIEITYKIEKSGGTVVCFTTRPDTNFGATFVVLAPEHPLVDKITTKDNKKTVGTYVVRVLKKTEQERIAEGQEKTGVFTGAYAINNLNGRRLPIWVSDFVLGNVGTGAVVGVPGHDRRDFAFAQKFNIDIIRVVVGRDGDKSPIVREEQVQEEEGTMINSGFLDGLDIHRAATKIMDYLEKKGWGERKTTYKLRDWCISRQRYWGPPIPMIYCEACAKKGFSWFNTSGKKTPGVSIGTPGVEVKNSAGWFPVPAKDLPVLLPDIDDYLSDGSGKAPLARHPEFYQTKCPQCGRKARRETDVSDTFLDSSWYFLRYPSISLRTGPSVGLKHQELHSVENRVGSPGINAESLPWDPDITARWLPVHKYIGGAEHSVLHLMYSRFLTMALHDMGYLQFEEPFTSFYAHGLIIKDGAKMSKSQGNVVNPDDYIAKYGADVLRCYLMFIGPLSQGGDFRDTGMKGMSNFLNRVWKLCLKNIKNHSQAGKSDEEETQYWKNLTIKRATKGIKRYKYNTCLAAIMEFVSFLSRQKNVGKDSLTTLLLLLAPFAPHMTEELWSRLNNFGEKKWQKGCSIHIHDWPVWQEKYLQKDETEIVVQVNGKKRDRIMIKSDWVKQKSEIIVLAKQAPRIQKYIQNKTIKREIYVLGKLVNLVI